MKKSSLSLHKTNVFTIEEQWIGRSDFPVKNKISIMLEAHSTEK